MAEILLTSVLELLLDRLIQEDGGYKQVEELVEDIVWELRMMGAVLEHMESSSQVPSDFLKELDEKLWHANLDAQNIIETALIAVARSRRRSRFMKMLGIDEIAMHRSRVILIKELTRVRDTIREMSLSKKHNNTGVDVLPEKDEDEKRVVSPCFNLFQLMNPLYASIEHRVESMRKYLNLMQSLVDATRMEDKAELEKIWATKMGNLTDLLRDSVQQVLALKNRSAFSLMARPKAYRKIRKLKSEIAYEFERKWIYDIQICMDQKDLQEAESSISNLKEDWHVPLKNLKTTATLMAKGLFPFDLMPLFLRGLLSYSFKDLKESTQFIEEELQLMEALFKEFDTLEEPDQRLKVWLEEMQELANDAKTTIQKYRSIKNARWGTSVLNVIKVANRINEIKTRIFDLHRRKMTYEIRGIRGRNVRCSMAQNPHGIEPATPDTISSDQSLPITLNQANRRGDEAMWSINFVEENVKSLNREELLMQALLKDLEAMNNPDKRLKIWVEQIRRIADVIEFIVAHHQESSSLFSRLVLHSRAQEEFEKKIRKIKDKIRDVHNRRLALGIEIRGKEASDSIIQSLHRGETTTTINIEDTSIVEDTSNGSNILITTQVMDVASHGVSSSSSHEVQLLSDEESWTLFTYTYRADIPRDMEALGRAIVERCGHSPEKIIDMGKLLSTKDTTIEVWSRVLKQMYEELPLNLMKCLYYFKLFPKGFKIPARRLIALWVAEGIVRMDDKPPEYIAKQYLNELIDRNMVEVVDKKFDGDVKTCLLSKATAIFLQDHINAISESSSSNRRTYHFADHLDTNHSSYQHIHGDNKETSLRNSYKDVLSFLSFDMRQGRKPGEEVGDFVRRCISSRCFILLRVLDLECVFKPKLPDAIGKLVQMRYLGLRWTFLEMLPHSISKLLKLQTLDVKHTYISTLPHTIWKMERLRHLYLSESFRSRFVHRPRGGSLMELQTLWGVFIDEESPVRNGLDRLVNLRKLGLACRRMLSQEDRMKLQIAAVANWIENIRHLQSLRLRSYNDLGEAWNLNLSALEELSNLYLLGALNIEFVRGRVPKGLTYLTLSASMLEADPFSVLKDLINLKVLRLFSDSYMGTSMHCTSGNFPRLRVLKLWKLKDLKTWIVDEEALPELRDLEIRSCKNLEELPEGLKHMKNLEVLQLRDMPQGFIVGVKGNLEQLHIQGRIPTIVKDTLEPQEFIVQFGDSKSFTNLQS